jgi:hypothetical protein
VFDDVPASHGAAVRRAVDVLSRHGIGTLWWCDNTLVVGRGRSCVRKSIRQ